MTLRILVVEDEQDFREALCDILSVEGFHAQGVGSMAAYRQWRANNSCDVLILDRQLPDGDGLEIAKMHRKTTDAVIIFLTGAGTPENRTEGYEADGDYYFVKPMVLKELLALIRRLDRRLDNQGLADAWLIDPVRWTLTSPDGTKVGMTKTEIAIMCCFIEKGGLTVPRHQLIGVLGGQPGNYDPRRLEIAIRRLRKKMDNAGVSSFPLTTIYGTGYSFNGPLSSL